MTDKISIPSIKFRIIIDGAWTDPQPYMENIDSLLKNYMFPTCPEWSDLGLEIKYDDIPWNKPESAESTLNLMTWFQGVERLINGETKVDIWAWEESDCLMSRKGSILTLSDLSPDEIAYCPEVSFYMNDFMREMYRAGQEYMKFWEILISRIKEISKDIAPEKIPLIVLSWIRENQKCDINNLEHYRRQWQSICESFLDKEILDSTVLSVSKKAIETIRLELEKREN